MIIVENKFQAKVLLFENKNIWYLIRYTHYNYALNQNYFGELVELMYISVFR